jgi:prepilin-type N-terminal cleavage/methylation domain-containing protein
MTFRNRKKRLCGVTLIELMVALSIAGITIGLVLFSWTFIARHTTIQKRKALLYSQTEAMITRVASEVRASPLVVSFSADSIGFVSQKTGDTVSYRWLGDTLYRKGTAVPIVPRCARVVRFSVEEDRESSDRQYAQQLSKGEKPDIVLVLTLGLKDCFGTTSVVPQRVKVRQPDNLAPAGSGWNF